MSLRFQIISWAFFVIFLGPCELFASSNCDPVNSRTHAFRFPIVLKGQPWLVGKRIDRIDAWAFRNGNWEKVPSQIDEVNREGNYVLEEGLPYTSNTDDGIFDDNDEFIVQGPSLGDSFTHKQIPQSVIDQYVDYVRFDLCGGRNGYLGSILLGLRSKAIVAESFRPLFDRSRGLIETSKYKYVFRPDQPMMMGDVILRSPKREHQVFAGSTFIMPLVPHFFLFPTIYFGESDFTSEIECWRSGPIRSIVAVGSKLQKFFKILDLHLFSELVFYEDYFQIPTKIEFIFDPSNILDRGSGLAYVLSYPKGGKWSLKSNLEPLPKNGPVMGEIKKTAFDQSPEGTFSVRGTSGSGSFMANVRVDTKALRQAPPPYLVEESQFQDENTVKNWPWLKKTTGSIAVFIDIAGVRRGTYDFALDVALSNQADDEFTDFQSVSAVWHNSKAF